jgi:uncharacterized membrane protein
MRIIIEFVKASLVGGVFVLLPILLLCLLLKEAFDVVVVMATPITLLFPAGTFDTIKSPTLVAVVLIGAVSFLIGLALRTGAGRSLGRWLEDKILDRLPVYGVLKKLVGGFSQVQGEGAFRPALLTTADGDREPAYIVEEHGDGQVTVLVPWAPTPFAGSIKVTSRDRVEELEGNLASFTKIIGHWGVGVGELLGKVGKA